jgi:hypothetical protein
LTIFIWHSEDIWNALTLCEELRNKIVQGGGDPDLLRALGKRPTILVITTVAIILLWEVYEWNVWFSTMGITFQWNMVPFPFVLVHYQYAILWWLFITIPFVFSQLAICVPSLFAMVMLQYCQFLNAELARLDQTSKCHNGSDLTLPVDRNEFGKDRKQNGSLIFNNTSRCLTF